MEQKERTRGFGRFLILCAIVLRLWAAGAPGIIARWIKQPHSLSLLIYTETGHDVRFSASSEEISPHFRESSPPVIPESEPDFPEFTAQEGEALAIYNTSRKQVDAGALLTRPLTWNLREDGPKVLILSTHTTESYTKTAENYEESSAYRTLSEEFNMLSIGDAVEKILEEGGIQVLRDRTTHDYPSYNGSYVHARKSLTEILAEHPTIRLVLDLHRDAGGTGKNQLRTSVPEDPDCAQLMLVMGTNYEKWEENLSLGLKFQSQLERLCPGITRPLCLRGQRFNQDLSPGALLVEVGAAGNTHSEALRAAQVLAEAVVALANGTQ